MASEVGVGDLGAFLSGSGKLGEGIPNNGANSSGQVKIMNAVTDISGFKNTLAQNSSLDQKGSGNGGPVLQALSERGTGGNLDAFA